MKLKIKILLALTFALLITIAGCNSNQPIKIGVVGTMTGPSADLAINGRRGIELAVEEINASGGINGRMIELVIKDSLNDTEVANSIVDEFVDENIELVIGDFTSTLTGSILDKINNENILYLSPSASADMFLGKDDNLIRFTSTTSNQASAIVRQANMNQRKKLLVFKDETNKGLVDSICASLEENSDGIELFKQVYYNGMQTIEPDIILNALEESEGKIDQIILLSNATSAPQIIRIIRDNGYNTDICVSSWANMPDFYRLVGDYAEGITILGLIDTTSTKKDYVDFSNKFNNYYGSDPTFVSVFAYDTMMTLYQAILDSKSTKANTIKETIIDTSIVYGLQSTFNIDEFGDCSRDYLIYKIKDGEAVLVE